MTVSLYQTGVSGLLSAQQQLATTGHNISNVNTEGYNRQRAEQNAAVGLNNGDNYIGSGTYIQDITRLYDQFSYKEQLLNQSNLGGANSLHSKLTQLDQIMSSSGATLSESMHKFYQGMNGVADNPSDPALRSIVLNQASVLSNDFSELQSDFAQMQKAVNGEIEQMASKISEISLELAKINETILHSQNNSQTGKPNDLLDKRDQLVAELGEYTRVNTIEDQNGVMSVMIGQGTTLVAGITPLTVSVVSGDPDPLKTELRLNSPNSSTALYGADVGGALAANFEFRDVHLLQANIEVERLAMAFSSIINDSQASGLDLNGLQGENIFSDINISALQQGRVLSPQSNSGNLAAHVNISDVSLVPTDEFEIRFDGTDFIMMNLTDKTTTNLGAPGSGTPAGTHVTPFGFEFVETGGTPNTDDSYLIKPTKNSAALMKVTLTNGDSIAASSAMEIASSDNNVSNMEVEISEVTDPLTLIGAGADRFELYESSPGVYIYELYNQAGVITSTNFYTPPETVISYGFFEVTISGTPSGVAPNAPEIFYFKDAFGSGNGQNALATSLTQNQGVLSNSKETFSQSLSITTAQIGSKASNAELSADTAQALYTQAYNRNQSTSGVNLDEEAANLLKFQQAYQAASQIVSVANTIFDTILSAVR
ncbi:flagellar hook-associated protein FlgK [Litorilituus lipolyticus]|uniref:Flagellar hook-associated protein 1 n=1 Tax=Litorilituus lipolyticus TaxID=2491017 RepID=A0A502KZT2_9GAMM|nr:flagellar hook-associated protein FlgK [Litorilituus lipolyticus]TPH17132.1 flagellar hook-associated protein FlgK [Litorilituus lipolyticus]